MDTIKYLAKEWLYGAPASAAHSPSKSDGMAVFQAIGDAITTVSSYSETLVYARKSVLNADLAHDENTGAYVVADPVAGNNGSYRKVGASGAGSWSRWGDLPISVIATTITGGTASAMVATSSNPIPSTDRAALISFVATTDSVNGGTTIAINGATAIDIVDAYGSAIVAGAWHIGQVVVGMMYGGDLQLLLPVYSVDKQIALRTNYATDAAFIAATTTGAYGYVVGVLKKNTGGTATTVSADELKNLLNLTTAETAARTAADATLTSSIDALSLTVNSTSDPNYRDTSAFVVVEIDEAGYAGRIEYFRETDAFETAYVDASGYAGHVVSIGGASLDWTEYRETDAYASITVDAAGYAGDGTRTNGSPMFSDDTSISPETGSGGSTGLLLIYGQSVFTGLGTTAVSTSVFPGIKTFNAGYTGLTDLVMSTIENGSRGSSEAFIQFFGSNAGYGYLTDHTQLVCGVGAVGGMSAWDLRSGGSYFSNLTTKIDAMAAIAASTGETVGILPLIYCQGEADINPLFDPVARHRVMEDLIRKPLEAYATTAFGYPVNIVMVLTQVASHQYYGHDEAVIAESDLNLCLTDKNYKWGGTMYQFDYGAGGVGSHLLTGTDVKHASAYAGRAAALVYLLTDPPVVRNTNGWVASSTSIMLEYDVPVEPLVIDTTTVVDPGNYGFRAFNSDTMTEIALSAVSVVNRRCIKLTTSSAIPAGGVTVRYAWSGGGDGIPAGRQTGSRGCVRDSDTSVFDPSGIAKNLYNWLPIHSVIIKR